MIFRLFDYLLLALPGLMIAIWAQWRVAGAYSAGSRMPAACGCTGAEAASAILCATGLSAIAIEPAADELCDHYDASCKTLRLSHRIHDGRSLVAVGVSAHEAGHAIQDASKYRWLVVRNAIVPLAGIGSQLFWLLILAGLLLGIDRFVLAGIGLFSSVLVFQLVNVPVELDATRRGRLALTTTGTVASAQELMVGNVMVAAAWTYVAWTLTGVVGFARGWR